MQKKIINEEAKSLSGNEKKLDLAQLAQVEVSSEDADYHIENALTFRGQSGWRAATAGRQTIRLLFGEPQRINTIHLRFREEQLARTQEFVLRWSQGNAHPFREIVRQQYNFSPASSTEEEENYTVHLDGVKVVELVLVPDIDGGNARASLSSLWIT